MQADFLLAWVPFRAESWAAAVAYLRALFGFGAALPSSQLVRGEVFSLHHVVMVGICYRVMRKNLLTFEQQWTDEACGRTPPKFVTDELPPPARTASSQLSVGRPRADTVTPLPPPALDVDPTSLKSTCAAICAPRRLHSFK